MNRLKGFSTSAELAICCVVLLLAVALSAPLWLGFFGTVEAGSNPSSLGRETGQTSPTPTPTVVSQGLELHNVDSWHTDGYKGQGVTIGIIDGGFVGYNTVGKELPTPAHVRCYASKASSPTSSLATCRTKYSHGTKVAEIIADIAPEATLYIANTGGHYSRSNMKSTVDAMALAGVQVINHSVVRHANTPGDGTSGLPATKNQLLDVIDYAAERGIVWVNAAGNDAQRVWYGPLNTATSGPSWHRFSVGEINNTISLKAGTRVNITMRWEDQWPGARCDLRMFLYNKASKTLVAYSLRSQKGASDHTPYEGISYVVEDGGDHDVRIWRFNCSSTNAPDWIQLLVRGETPSGGKPILKYSSSDHHIVVPAESGNAGMLAVAAASHTNTNAIVSYSSQGPTVRGSIKPDITGATDVRTRTDSSFDGTSAAAPHVAGMAALWFSRYGSDIDQDGTPDKTTEIAGKVVDELKGDALARGASGEDKVWGWGFAALPDVAAEAELSSSAGEPSVSRQITLRSAQTFTLATNLADTPGVEISVNKGTNDTGLLTLGNSCRGTLKDKETRGNGDRVTLRGCAPGSVTVILSHNGKTGTGREIERYKVSVHAPPPTELELAAAGTNSLRLKYKGSQEPHRYQFRLERRDLSAPSVTWDEAVTQNDNSSPEVFIGVTRGYQYRVIGWLCSDSGRTKCGTWSRPSGVVEFSDPQIAISGLASSLNPGGNDGFSVSLSDLTRDQPYTVTLSADSAGMGFNASCTQSASRAFTPTSVNRNGTLNFILYGCSTTTGTVKVRLRKGSSSGAEVAKAAAAVRVNETASLSPAPATFVVGNDQTFTVSTNASDEPGVWVGVNYSGDAGELAVNSCQDRTNDGRKFTNGDTVTIRGCEPGSVTIRIYRNTTSTELASYSVTVNAATASLSPAPATFVVGNDQTFTVSTNASDEPGVWVGGNYSGDAGELAVNSCQDRTNDGRKFTNGDTVTIRGCEPGSVTIRIYRNTTSTELASYSVTVNAATASLSPAPATFVVGNDQTFTVSTNASDEPGVWVGVNYSGDAGELAVNSCQDRTNDGRKFTNGDTVTIRGCEPGSVTIRIYRNTTSTELASYSVTVNAATASLSPAPATFVVGNDQTFTVSTNASDEPGVWVGVNYSGDAGELAVNSCQDRINDGRKFTDGDTVTIRGCEEGAVTIRIYRNTTSKVLATYTVTVNAATASLSPAPATFVVGNDQTFTVSTNASDEPGVWVGVNYSGDAGKLGVNGCQDRTNDGRKFTDGDTVTIRGCEAGAVTIRIYRNTTSKVLASYTVTVS